MRKKIFKLQALMLSLIILLSACGGNQEAKEGDTTPQTTDSGKTVITYGTVVMDPAIQRMIKLFNIQNPDYEIEIKDYGKDASSDEEAVTRLNFDVLNGTGPDILVLPVYYSMDLYAEKGVLEDLYPYLDRDEEITRETFLSNILQAYEIDGKLYGMPITFDIDTMVGAGSVLGDRTGWTLNEMMEFTGQFEPGTDIFENSSQSAVMNVCLKANWSRFVSWGKEGFSFDRELYKQILEFAGRFPKDEEYVINRKYQERIRENDLMLLEESVDVFHVSCDQLYSSLFGEPVTYIGYPTEEGNGSLIWSLTTVSINAQSSQKEAAWEFLRILLGKEYYEDASYVRGFSVRKDVLEQQLMEAKDGWVNSFLGEDFSLEIQPTSTEEVERIRSLIESADTMRAFDYTITNILLEEAGNYFSGVKSADQVADVAENRIRTYVNEMR